MENEKRLIDAKALGIGKAKREAFNDPAYADGWNSAIAIIENAPTVDAVEVVHGRNTKDTPSRFECSVCHWECWDTYCCDTYDFNYCPNCGAKMDGGNEDG